jgi:hypothetical protein
MEEGVKSGEGDRLVYLELLSTYHRRNGQDGQENKRPENRRRLLLYAVNYSLIPNTGLV